MAAESETLPDSDRRQLLEAADALITALESARLDAALWRIRGDLGQLQHDVARVRRAVEHQPTLELWALGVFTF